LVFLFLPEVYQSVVVGQIRTEFLGLLGANYGMEELSNHPQLWGRLGCFGPL